MVSFQQFLLKLAVGVLAVINGGTGTIVPPTAGQVLIGKADGKYTPADLTAGTNVTITKGDGTIEIAASGGGGGGAPTTATYITQTPDAGLSAEQDVASLATGLLVGTNTTGVLVGGRTITAGSSKISVSNGSGLAGNPGIDAVEANFTHNNLGGLTTGDPHTQYLLLAGRAGGQTANGGTGAGDDLDLRSTSNGTKGSIFLGATGNYGFDEVNSRFFLGDPTPHFPLDMGSGTGKKLAVFQNGSGGNFYGWEIQASELRTHADDTAPAMHTWYSGGAEMMRLTSVGQLGIGVTPASTEVFHTSKGVGGGRWFNDVASTTDDPALIGRKARGDKGAETAVQADDVLMQVLGRGYGTTGYTASSRGGLRILASENWSDTLQGTYVTIRTTTTGGTTTADKVRIADAGDVAIAGNGTLAPPTVSLEVQGTDAMLLPSGTTAQRSAGVNGQARWNSDTRQFEGRDEGAWKSFVGVLDRASAQLDVNTTASATTFYTFDVPANILDTDKMLRLSIFGDYLQNNGAARTLTVELLFGGSVFYAATTATITASASRHPFVMQFTVANQNATNVQSIGGYVWFGNAGGATTGLGQLNTFPTAATGPGAPIYNTGNIDTTALRTLLVRVTHSASSANQSLRRQYAILEVL